MMAALEEGCRCGHDFTLHEMDDFGRVVCAGDEDTCRCPAPWPPYGETVVIGGVAFSCTERPRRVGSPKLVALSGGSGAHTDVVDEHDPLSLAALRALRNRRAGIVDVAIADAILAELITFKDAIADARAAIAAQAARSDKLARAPKPPDTKKCVHCGDEFQRRASMTSNEKWANVRYCSRRCSARGRTRPHRAAAPRKPPAPKIAAPKATKPPEPVLEKPCERCGNTFKKPSGLGLGDWAARRYCGRMCAGVAYQERRRERVAKPSAVVPTDDDAMTIGEPRAVETKVCERCLNAFERLPSRTASAWKKQRFCGRTCSGASNRGRKRGPRVERSPEAISDDDVPTPLPAPRRRSVGPRAIVADGKQFRPIDFDADPVVPENVLLKTAKPKPRRENNQLRTEAGRAARRAIFDMDVDQFAIGVSRLRA